MRTVSHRPLFEKRHFEFIASALRDCNAPSDLIREFSYKLLSTNDNFSRTRFIEASTSGEQA
jgi:hypothetical protein